MSKLLEKVRALVQEHAEEIKKDWAPYNSDHEASSVLREEIDEARDELVLSQEELSRLWSHIKDSKGFLNEDVMPDPLHFERLAEEAIQCAAVCYKWRGEKESGCNPFSGNVVSIQRNKGGFITSITLKNGTKIDFRDEEGLPCG